MQVKGNTHIPPSVAKRTVQFMDQTLSDAHILLAYLDLARSPHTYPGVGQAQTYIEEHFGSTSPPSSAQLHAAYEAGLLPTYNPEESYVNETIIGKLKTQGDRANDMSGHKLSLRKPKTRKNHSGVKYRPGLPYIRKGEGEHRMDDGVIIEDDYAIPQKYTKLKTEDEQSIPKIDWKAERRFRNKRHRIRYQTHKVNLGKSGGSFPVGMREIRMGNKVFYVPNIGKPRPY